MGRQTENAHHARAAVPPGGIAGVGRDTVSPDDVPNLSLAPINNAPPSMHQAVSLGCGVGTVDFHFVVLRSPGALLAAFAGDDQNFDILRKFVDI